MVDKNLFLHDLAVVAIMKNEAPYLKEWLDYHLLAGVDHFYIYDNESPDNQAYVAKPYVEAGFVDYIPAPGKVMQTAVYNDAIKRFKFQNRYMAFIDGDEFVYPKVDGGGVIDIVDDIFSQHPTIAGLAINWHCFGSNNLTKADLSHGVLERFTRRAPNDWTPKMEGWPEHILGGNAITKLVINPRKSKGMNGPHNAYFFENYHLVNETGRILAGGNNYPVTADKIIINHYNVKTREEYQIKINRGNADTGQMDYCNDKTFLFHDRNEEFDDGILRYRFERAKNFRPPDKSHTDEKLLNALMINLSPTLVPTTPPQFYAGKMETFLTCRAVAAYLQTKLPDDVPLKFFEETALKAILRTLASGGMTFADARLLIRELPNLLSLPYPVVKDLRNAALQIIPQLMNIMRLNGMWEDYAELDYTQDLLKLI